MKKAISEESRPVGPPMQPREGLEFLVALANINPSTLETRGRPENLADLGHAAGVFYELCRFAQAPRRFYEMNLDRVIENPRKLIGPGEISSLLGKIADGETYEVTLLEHTKLRISGQQFKRTPFRTPLPFVINSPSFAQALVVTAVFYLGLTRDSSLIRRCRECDKLFMAVRKSKVFCSHACASAASVRRFRNKTTESNNKAI